MSLANIRSSIQRRKTNVFKAGAPTDKGKEFPMQPSRAPRRGFTLVELLVVIAIIVILASILFPVFTQAQERAQQTSCLSNANQLGKALMMYVQDYDERFHDANNLNGGSATRPEPASNGFGAKSINAYSTWPWFYGPYVKNLEVFNCPTSPDKVAHLANTNWTYDGNYGYNYDGLSRDVNHVARIVAEIEYPAETFVFFDSGDPTVSAGTNNWAGLLENLDLDWATLDKEMALRHQGRANVVFADGHAKSVTPTTLLTRKADNVAPWMIEWTDCNPDCPPPSFDTSKLP